MLSSAKVEKEIVAQQERLKALAYLSKQGQSVHISGHPSSSIAQKYTQVQRDNTLDLILKDKIKDIQQKDSSSHPSKVIENEMKSSLLSQQLEGKNNQIYIPIKPWSKLLDPVSNLYYYWNTETNETTWEKPNMLTPNHEDINKVEENKIKSLSTPVPQLPSGWKELVHAATKQIYYFNEKTGEKRSTPPSNDSSFISLPTTISSSSSLSSLSNKNNSMKAAIKTTNDSKKRRLIVDPLDPTGGMGNYNDQLDGQMADSTASGPLWQQRPYPAPGKILKKNEGSKIPSIGPTQLK